MVREPQVGDKIFFEKGDKVNALIPEKFVPGGAVFSEEMKFRFISIGDILEREKVPCSLASEVATAMNNALRATSGFNYQMISKKDIEKLFKHNGLSREKEYLDTSCYAGEYQVTLVENHTITCVKNGKTKETLVVYCGIYSYSSYFAAYGGYDPATKRLVPLRFSSC